MEVVGQPASVGGSGEGMSCCCACWPLNREGRHSGPDSVQFSSPAIAVPMGRVLHSVGERESGRPPLGKGKLVCLLWGCIGSESWMGLGP